MRYLPLLAIAFAAPCFAERPLSETERAAVVAAVSNEMRDPESTQFRWLPVNDAEPLYCGLFNSKNGYGGYVGFRAFVVQLPGTAQAKVRVMQLGSATTRAGAKDLAAMTCEHNRYDLSAATSVPAPAVPTQTPQTSP